MGKGNKNKKGGGHNKGAEKGQTEKPAAPPNQPPQVQDIPRTDLYSIIEKLKKSLRRLKKFETPKTDEKQKQGRPLMPPLKHAPGQKTNENTSIGGLFAPSEIFDKYKKARQGILNKIDELSTPSDVRNAKGSIRETEKQFIVDLGDRVKAVRAGGRQILGMQELAHYTKTLYVYLKLLMLAANKAGGSPQETYDEQLKALDTPGAGSYSDVLTKDRVLILLFQAKKHSLLSVCDTEKAQALDKLETGQEGSDLDPKTKLDKSEKEATDEFKLAQQELWEKNTPIDKMLDCIG